MKKKYMLLLVVLVVCASLAACKQAMPSTTTTATLNLRMIIDVYLESFYTPEEYEEFIATCDKLPEDFVEAEDLSHFGTFSSLVFTSRTYADDYSKYLYSLNGADGQISIYVYHGETYQPTDDVLLSADDVNLSDMRWIDDDTVRGTYTLGTTHYIYRSGKLILIECYTENLEYVVMTYGFDTIAVSQDTTVGKLLNIEGKDGDDLVAIISGN